MNIATNGSRKCAICDEIHKGYKDGLYYLYAKQNGGMAENRILYEDEQFVIMPSLGPVSKCHLLMMPKRHIVSYALLEEEVFLQMERVLKKVTNYVKANFGSCIIFEHGTLTEEMQGSASCTHAHMHIVSCSESLLPFLEREGMEIRKIEALTEIKKQSCRNKPYFFYAEDRDNMFIMDDIIQKSQYMRMLVADILKHSEKGDWKKNPQISKVEEMIREIRKEGGFI